jgi:hypothetical protein
MNAEREAVVLVTIVTGRPPAIAEARARAKTFGHLVPQEIHRAVTCEYRWADDRDARRDRDLRIVYLLAQHAWCAALSALQVRETPCRCLLGGGHVGKPLESIT